MPLRVNGETIDDSVLRNEERLIRPRLEEAMAHEDPRTVAARVRQWARENVIERVVLRQTALQDPTPIPAEAIDRLITEVRTQSPNQSGYLAPVDDATLRKDLEIRLRVERLMATLTEKITPPKNRDISAYYVANRATFQAPPAVHASHIVKNVDEKTSELEALSFLRQIEEQLHQGVDFAQLADQFSDCPGRGGDLGFFPAGQMVPEFDKVVFALQPGQLSGIFRTPFGFHIVKLHERRPEGIRGLQEVHQEIAQALLEEKRQRVIEQYLDRLIAKARVEEVPS